jgi:hypothetical protein
MPGPTTLARGNCSQEYVLAITISPSSVAPNTTAEQTFAVTGLLLGDALEINKPTSQGGLGIVNQRVSSAGVLAIAFGNFTAATITPTANEVYYLVVTRPENLISGNSSLTQIV